MKTIYKYIKKFYLPSERYFSAIFAKNLLYETPAEATKFNFSRISCLMARAISTAKGMFFLFSVTSKKASSKERGSTRSVYW